MRLILYSVLISTALGCTDVGGRRESSRADFPPPLYRCSRDIMGSDGKPATYSGFYEAEFESSAFKLSGAPCEVWLTGAVCPIFGKAKCVKGAEVKAYVTVEGVLSEPGRYGHRGMWQRELRVTRVIKVHRIEERGSSEEKG